MPPKTSLFGFSFYFIMVVKKKRSSPQMKTFCLKRKEKLPRARWLEALDVARCSGAALVERNAFPSFGIGSFGRTRRIRAYSRYRPAAARLEL